MREIAVYVAGPSVFAKNAEEIAKKQRKICEEAGLKCIHPLDKAKEIARLSCKEAQANVIFENCVRGVYDADIIVADLNHFRGKGVDDGTSFEVGLAYGKPIYGYLADNRSLRERYGEKDDFGEFEDFGLPVNVMLAKGCCKIVNGGFKEAIEVIRRDYADKSCN